MWRNPEYFTPNPSLPSQVENLSKRHEKAAKNSPDLDEQDHKTRSKPPRSVKNIKLLPKGRGERVHGPEHRRGFVPAVEPLAHRSARAGEGAEEDGDDGDEELYDHHQIGEGARRHIRELAASSSPTPAPSSSPPASLTLA